MSPAEGPEIAILKAENDCISIKGQGKTLIRFSQICSGSNDYSPTEDTGEGGKGVSLFRNVHH